jgi:uncharacterized protein with HEPN domain
MKSNDIFHRHVLDEINFLLEHTRALHFEDFMKDGVLKRACARSFEVMGEAVKNIPTDFKRRRKAIDWKNIAGMRDKLIHQYFGMNWNILWDAIKEKLPDLKVHIEKLLEGEKRKQ